MDNKSIQIYENGFQSNAYNNPQIPIYIRKGNLSIFDYSFNAHWHRDFEVIRVINGSMKYNIDGQVTELYKDDVLFVNSDRMHFGYSDSKMECNYICLVFDYGLLCSNAYIKDNYILNIVNDASYPYVIIKNKSLNKVIDDLYSFHDCLSYDLKAQSYLYDIFSYIFEVYIKSPKNKIERKNFSKIRNMIDFIKSNYQRKITLNDIAKAGNVSKNTCINYFRENLNQSPIDFLINYRLEKSIELLLNTDLSIIQIANETGFCSSSHYGDLFKKFYNLTPSQLRRKDK